MSVQKRTVLITGAAVRVGSAIAKSLSRAGWDVVIHYHTSADAAHALQKEIHNQGRVAHLERADLSDDVAVSSLIPSLTKKNIHLDALINNASVFTRNTLAQLTPQNWHAHMQVNCFAPLQLIRDFAAAYKGESGAVVNITDGLDGWSISPSFLSYSLSKRALLSSSSVLAPARCG